MGSRRRKRMRDRPRGRRPARDQRTPWWVVAVVVVLVLAFLVRRLGAQVI
jgi:hypothetical protein